MENTAWGASLRSRTMDSHTAKGSGSQPGRVQQALGSGAQEEI